MRTEIESGRELADDDFRDDAVDASEIGPGHHITEVRLMPGAHGPLGTLDLRAEPPGAEGQPPIEQHFPIDGPMRASLDEAGSDARIAIAAATVALRLARSPIVASTTGGSVDAPATSGYPAAGRHMDPFDGDEAFSKLVFDALDHGTGSIEDEPGPLIPFALTQGPSGMQLVRFAGFDYARDQQSALTHARSGEFDRWAVASDGYLTLEGTRTDAVFVHAARKDAAEDPVRLGGTTATTRASSAGWATRRSWARRTACRRCNTPATEDVDMAIGTVGGDVGADELVDALETSGTVIVEELRRPRRCSTASPTSWPRG